MRAYVLFAVDIGAMATALCAAVQVQTGTYAWQPGPQVPPRQCPEPSQKDWPSTQPFRSGRREANFTRCSVSIAHRLLAWWLDEQYVKESLANASTTNSLFAKSYDINCELAVLQPT